MSRRFLQLIAPVAYGISFANAALAGPLTRLEAAFRENNVGGEKAEIVRAALTPAEAETPQSFTVALRFHRMAELERRVAAGESVSRAEMAERYLPSEADVRAVNGWLAEEGFSLNENGSSRSVLLASGTPRQLAATFHTGFARVRFRREESTAAISAPSVPAEIEPLIADVHGLQPYLRPRSQARFVTRDESTVASFAPPYQVSDILTAYGETNLGWTGAGQCIGVIVEAAPLPSDLSQFWEANGIPDYPSRVKTVNVSGGSLPAPTGEETLDVSWASGIAPSARIVTYACGSFANVQAAYGRVLEDLQSGVRPDLHTISMSFGAGEQTGETQASVNAAHQLFTAMAAMGVTLVSSSGDYGAYGMDSGTIEAIYPATDPLVTSVGATALTLDPQTGAVASETAWSLSAGSAQASGGGVSVYFQRPAWQANTSFTMRAEPDVAIAGDPDTGAYLVLNGKVEQVGGTSWSTPCWAGLCALINQARARADQPSLGAVNARLYSLAGTSAFRDIVAGSEGVYGATAGYDLMTGLGSPQMAELLPALAPGVTADEAAIVPVISSPLEVSAEAGTPFAYRIKTPHAATAFFASDLPTGWSIEESTGLIAGTPAEPGEIDLTINATGVKGTASEMLRVDVTLPGTLPKIGLNVDSRGFVIELAAPARADLSVQYVVSGTAQNGVDYRRLRGVARVPAGRTARRIRLESFVKATGETVELALEPGPGYIVGASDFESVRLPSVR